LGAAPVGYCGAKLAVALTHHVNLARCSGSECSIQWESSYARLCGRTLARALARSADPAVLAGYMGKGDVFDDALASFATAYAAQNGYASS
jgi:hypothetical protein